jgi:asparagine synthase (glutamine-hydrolysing)
MPGIVGIIGRGAEKRWESQVENMVSVMRHEPFYHSGTYGFPELGIYCGWVAHERSFASDQVFLNQERDVALVFSGECFLDTETRALVRGWAHAAEAHKGSWLIPLYLELGERFFEQLNGLFSGLLIDQRRGNAFLFNDRYGIERLYWHESKEAFYFASEAKALLRILPELREFDKQGVAEYLRFGCTICPRTLFKGIESLPPGSLWCFEGGSQKRRKYFEFEKWEAQATCSAPDFRAEFEETFKRILPCYFQSNEKIGISLTAGLDGRLIMACLPPEGSRPICYTFAGQAENLLDERIAAKVAAACGLEHHALRIGADFFNNFGLHADRTVHLTDGCLGLLGAHEAYFNRQARRLSPVRLTGVFGGEICREVSFYKPVRFNHELLSPDWNRLLKNADRRLSDDKVHPVTTAVTREIPDRRFGVVAAGRSQTTFRTPYLDNELVALAYRTPPALRASPEPVIAAIKNTSETLGGIPTDMGFLGQDGNIASSVRRIVGRGTFKLDYFYSEGLPNSLRRYNPILDLFDAGGTLFGRHKFLQYRKWFQQELADFVCERIRGVADRGSELWNSAYLHKMVKQQGEGRENYSKEINIVLTLEAVERLLLQAFGRERNGSVSSPFAPVESAASRV